MMMRAHVWMTIRAVVIGLSFHVVGSMGKTLPPLLLTAIRFFIAALAMTPLLRRVPDRWPGFPGLALYCILGFCQALFFGAMFLVAHRTSAIAMTALYVTVPFLAYALGLAFRVERQSLQLLGILGLGAGGAFGLAWADSGQGLGGLHLGRAEGIFLAGCVGLAFYSVLAKWGLSRRWLSQNTGVRTFWSLAIGALLVGAFGLLEEAPSRLSALTPRDALLLVYLGLFSTGATFWLMQRAIAVLSPAEVNAYSYAPPFVSMLLTFSLEPERVSWRWLPGAALVLLAIALLLRRGAGALPANTEADRYPSLDKEPTRCA
jgi:drug/metabolite transporter (DMT)-like permease